VRSGWRRRSGTALVLAGIALAGSGAAVLLWPEPRVRADVGSMLAAPPSSAAPSGSSAPRSTPASPAPTSAPSGFVPERLVVPSLEIDAPLVPETVDGDGALGLPEDPARLAWWRGVRAGVGAGSVLVAGHLDMSGYGWGPLARLVDLRPGDRAVLTGAGGVDATYVLRGVTTVHKRSLREAGFFGADGPERLVLVTCGGEYDPDLRSWDSNVIAVLDPVAAD
jgi:hypothetical protein